MSDNESTEPIYPCRFPVKVIGGNCENLQEIIIRIMASLGETIKPEEMSVRQSSKGSYLSITFEVVAQSLEHIEQIFAALKADKAVRMVL